VNRSQRKRAFRLFLSGSWTVLYYGNNGWRDTGVRLSDKAQAEEYAERLGNFANVVTKTLWLRGWRPEEDLEVPVLEED